MLGQIWLRGPAHASAEGGRWNCRCPSSAALGSRHSSANQAAIGHRLVEFAGELGGYPRQREPAFGRTQQPLTSEAIFNRHWVGFAKQQPHECFKLRPDAASVAMLRETAAPAWLEIDMRHARTMRAVLKQWSRMGYGSAS